jgi:hypothetical protein
VNKKLVLPRSTFSFNSKLTLLKKLCLSLFTFLNFATEPKNSQVAPKTMKQAKEKDTEAEVQVG